MASESKKFSCFTEPTDRLPDELTGLPGCGGNLAAFLAKYKDALQFDGLSVNRMIALYFFLERDTGALVMYLTRRVGVDEKYAKEIARAMATKFIHL